MAAILQFKLLIRRGWSPSEQAEFARTALFLGKAGLPILCETGVSDEGDPWVIFVREDTGDVVVHIARLDGQIVAASTATNDVVAGPNFRAIMDRIVRTQPLVMPATTAGDRLYLHPSAVIVAFIATALTFLPEDDVRPHGRKWKLLDDGSVALASSEGRLAHGGGILREGLLSKNEAARLGLDSASGDLANPLVVAAIVAAAAAVAQSSDFWSGDDAHATSAEYATPVDHGRTIVHQDANALPDAASAGSTAASLSDSQDGASSKFVQLSSHDAVSVQPIMHESMVAPEARHADAVQDQTTIVQTVFVSAADSSPVGTMTPQVTARAPDAHHEHDGVAAPAPSRPAEFSVVEPAVGTAAVAAPVVSVHATVTPNITISSDANELLSMLFSSKQIPSASFVTATIGNISLSADLAATASIVKDGGAAVAVSPAAHQDAAPTSTGEASPSATSGYQLISEILAFAFNPASEVAATASLGAMQQALHDRIYLPSGDRVVIIDVPDLHNDIFNFSDGVTMMSQATAEKLLPGVEMHAQSELTLANGTTLKLIGVVDIQHAGAVYA